MIVNITGVFYLPSGDVAASRMVAFKPIDRTVRAGYLGGLVPDPVIIQTGIDGSVDFNLLTGSYFVTIEAKDTDNIGRGLIFAGKANVPDAPSASISEILDAAVAPDEPPVWYTQAIQAAEDAIDAATRAEGAAPFPDRAAAEAAHVPANVTIINVDGLQYRREPGATDLVTADGATWAQIDRKNTFDATRAPLPTDDETQGYAPGSRWLWQGREWTAEAVTGGSARWVETTVYSESSLQALLASERPLSAGAMVTTRAEGQSYEVVASGGDLVTEGGVHLRRVVRPDDQYEMRGQTYMPTITRALVDAGGSLYRHVPAIAVRADGHVLGAYLRNQTSGAESADYQRAVFVRSSDNGATWTAPAEELNEAATATNPLTVAARPLQGEIFVAYDKLADQEVATVAHRGVSPGSGYISFRDTQAGAKWTNYRILFDSAVNPILSSDSLDGTPPAGLSQLMQVDGTSYEVVTFKPVFDRTGHTLVVPLLLVTAFGVDHRVAFMIRRNGSWSVSAPIPLGEVDIGATWEPTTWQADDGTWYCQGRNNNGLGGASYDNHVIASSPDLQSWSPFVYLDADVHVNRIIKARASDRLWMGVGTTHPSNRNALSLWLSVDGHQWSHGRTISDEADGAAWAQYSDLDFHEGEAYVLYTASEPTTAAAPNTVRFARFPLPTGVPISGSDSNHYLLDGGTKPSIRDGFALVIPPRMRGAVAGCGRPHVLTLRCRVTAAPGPVPYVLAAVGNSRWGYLTVEYRQGAGGTELFAGGVKVADVASPTSWTTIQINIDPLAGHATAYGQTRATGRFASVYLGDVSPGGTDQTGNIEYDGARSGLIIYPAGLPRLLRPEAPPLIGPSVTAQGIGDNADLITDAGPGKQASVRYRIDGTTRATTFYDAQINALREMVGGSSVRRIVGGEHEMQMPVKMVAPLRAPASSISIASDAITVTRMAHELPAGTIATINGGAVGDLLILRPAATGQAVTIKHATGNIFCGGSDKVMTSVQHSIVLHRVGASWQMLCAQVG